MEKLHKFNSLLKILILIMLSLYLLIYIGPIGIYDTNKYKGIFEEDDTFEEDRLWAAAMVGISSTLLMIVLYVNEKSEVRKKYYGFFDIWFYSLRINTF